MEEAQKPLLRMRTQPHTRTTGALRKRAKDAYAEAGTDDTDDDDDDENGNDVHRPSQLCVMARRGRLAELRGRLRRQQRQLRVPCYQSPFSRARQWLWYVAHACCVLSGDAVRAIVTNAANVMLATCAEYGKGVTVT